MSCFLSQPIRLAIKKGHFKAPILAPILLEIHGKGAQMKQKVMLCLLVLLLPAAIRARERQVSMIGTVGMAAGNGEKLILNMGIEMEVFRHFYAQVGFDNFLEGDEWLLYARDGQVSLMPQMRTRIIGMNLLGAFKLPLTRRAAWFARAGLSYTLRTRYLNNDYNFGYIDFPYEFYYRPNYLPYRPEDREPAQTGLAYALGTGIEYRLSEKLALLGGGTYESLFDPPSSPQAEGADGDWVKLYVGVSYRIR